MNSYSAAGDRSNYQPYAAVHVLLLYWKEGNEEFYEQLCKLANEFEKSYHFEVEKWPIESIGPHRKLNQKLDKFLDYGKQGNLLIVYYGGHGGIDKDRNHTWLCHDPATFTDERANPTINWNSLQQLFLGECESHVLLVLDCCKAAASIQYTSSSSVVEAILAAGFENMTPLRSQHSFTAHLVLTLKDLRGIPVTASHLCNKVGARLKAYRPVEVGNEKRVTPHHFSLHDNINAAAIVISILDKDSLAPKFEAPISQPPSPLLQAQIAQQPSILSPSNDEIIWPSSDTSFSDMMKLNPESAVLPSHSRPPSVSSGSMVDSRMPRPYERPNSPRYRKNNSPKPGIVPSTNSNLSDQVTGLPKKDTYRYTPMSSTGIRLLHLQPGQGNDLICCRFSTREPEDFDKQAQDYHAISYYWGPESSHQELRIIKETPRDSNLRPSYDSLSVRPTLHHALRRLRHERDETILWIDVLCINQRNTEERNMQIELLPQIFNNACHVCVWLGNDESSIKDLDVFISKLLDLSQVDRIVASESEPEEWLAFAHLLMRPWFGRRWVIQELISAREATLYYGSTFAIDWLDFCDAVALFGSKFEEVKELFRASPRFNYNPDFLVDIRGLSAYSLVEASRNLFRQSFKLDNTSHRAGLEMLVSYLPAQQSTDPRDAIYALLALSSDAQPPLFKVNYTLSPIQVFKDFVEFCVCKSKSLDIICRHWAPEPNSFAKSLSANARPSWISSVSGLAFGRRGKNLYGRNNGDSLVGTPDRKFYNASKGTLGMVIFGEVESKAPVIHTTTDPWPAFVDKLDGSMIVSGFQLHEIVSLGPRAADGAILSDWIQMGEWKNGDTYVAEHFWRSLVADRGPNGIPPPTWYHRACLYCLEQSEGGDVILAELTRGSCPSMAIEFLNRVRNVIWNRKFMRTSEDEGEGLFGLAPPAAKEGDVICILYGCSVPVVLRRHKRFHGAWELIGECFVYGMMDGEATSGDVDWITEEFELR